MSLLSQHLLQQGRGSGHRTRSFLQCSTARPCVCCLRCMRLVCLMQRLKEIHGMAGSFMAGTDAHGSHASTHISWCS